MAEETTRAALPDEVLGVQSVRNHLHNEFVGLARQCYEEAVKRLPTPQGEVTFLFTIVGDTKTGGIVESADVLGEAELRDDKMLDCMRESLLGVSFPAPDGDRPSVTVKYALTFPLSDDNGG